MTVYRPRRPARAEFLPVRGLDYCIHAWGPAAGRPLLLLHGWMDSGATWQFMVDAMAAERRVLAPDWRGFGRSSHAPGGYYFPDYLADLDAILAQLSPDAPVDIVGHSMGGNVAGLFAGVRPERVRRLALLEGFGMARRGAEEAPARYRRWLDEQCEPPVLRPPSGLDALVRRFLQRHPRLTEERARFIAEAWTAPAGDGGRCFRADPRHKAANPVLYRLEEAEACWQGVTAPTLWLVGEESRIIDSIGGEEELRRRQALFARVTEERIARSGHMLHHDQPAAVAGALERFMDAAD